jgi:hypothetical protein
LLFLGAVKLLTVNAWRASIIGRIDWIGRLTDWAIGRFDGIIQPPFFSSVSCPFFAPGESSKPVQKRTILGYCGILSHFALFPLISWTSWDQRRCKPRLIFPNHVSNGTINSESPWICFWVHLASFLAAR